VEGDLEKLTRDAAEALRERAHQLLGIGRRSGVTCFGLDEVVRVLKAQAAHLVVVAGDASPRTRAQVQEPARMQGIPILEGPSVQVLGALLGRGDVAVAAITSGALAHEIQWLCDAAVALVTVPRKKDGLHATVESGDGGA
jgi:ribosomal protein L7Ae-like RNA K-turn-binding protein